LTKEFQSIEDDAMLVMQAFKAAQDALAVKNKELEQIQGEYESMKKQVEKIRSVEVDISNKMEDILRHNKDHQQKQKHWKDKMDKAIVSIKENQDLLSSSTGNTINGDGSDGATTSAKNDEQDSNNGNSNNNDEEELNQAANAQDDAERKKWLTAYQALNVKQLEKLKRDDLQYSITVLEESLNKMKPNMRAIEEYRRKEREYAGRVKQLDGVTSQRDEARQVHDALRKKRLDEFMQGFSIITMKLKEMYQMLTLGGDAELELVDSLDPFSEGILFSVRPPKKSWKNIQNLSGGEKTLSSLALVFALHHFKPTPLYVMDEIDAALDFKNVSIVANYIKERTKNAQFVIISLRNNMFELADRLVGIYKTDNVTKSITIDPRQFEMPNVNAAGQVGVNGKSAQTSSAPFAEKSVNESAHSSSSSSNGSDVSKQQKHAQSASSASTSKENTAPPKVL
jgi:structural maintenance of chromosome 4